MKPRIFLSYSNRDRAIAQAVEVELHKLGVASSSADSVTKPGSTWSKAIMDAVKNSDLVAVFLTEPGSAAEGWIGYEVGSASALGKDIVVFKPSTYSVMDLPADLASWQTLDFDPNALDRVAKTLVSSLAAVA